MALAAIPVVAGLASAPAFGTGSRNPEPVEPIYNPETKSYFELRTDLPNPPTWETAMRVARTKRYKGVRGRLAVVNNVQIHSFLKANFPVYEEAWIGLRFICSVRKLVWVTGDIQPLGGFKAWAKKWHRSQVTCRTAKIPFMGVTYTPTETGFHWQAAGYKKHYISYFVEYRTGKP